MPLPSYYPSADEITSVTTYEYDAAHNRVARVRDGGSASYSYNNLNQMTGYTEAGAAVDYTYDANGNRKTRTQGPATDTYDYDYENRLVGVSKGGVSHAYTYDYRTRRVERVEGGTAVKIVFSGGTSVQEYVGANVQAEYVRGSDYGGGIGGLLYSLRAGVPSYTHYNNRGDVVAKTGTSGAVTWQATYEAFGKRPAETGATLDRQKANTKEEDPTGLLNEGFRYRDLETGEFITRDPAGFVDGPNLYAYVRQNPWTHFDPEGLFSWGSFGKGVLIGVGVALVVAAVVVAAPAIIAAGAASAALAAGATAASAAAVGASAGAVASSAIALSATVAGMALAPKAAAYIGSAISGKETTASWTEGVHVGGALPEGEQEKRIGMLVGGVGGSKLGSKLGGLAVDHQQAKLTQQAAMGEAQTAMNEGATKGAAGAMMNSKWQLVTGRSQNAYPRGREPITDSVKQAYGAGRTTCAEPDILSKAERAGIDMTGGKSAVANVSSDFTPLAPKAACGDCGRVLSSREIHDLHQDAPPPPKKPKE